MSVERVHSTFPPFPRRGISGSGLPLHVELNWTDQCDLAVARQRGRRLAGGGRDPPV